jgi:hypothetical protein
VAQDSWPSPNHNTRNVTDPEYEKIAARFSDDGVWGDPTDTAVVTAGTGLQVVVRSGVHASVRGHAWTSGTTDVTLTIGANASGQTRIDRVVLRLDRATWDVRAVVKEGTPGSGAPSLTQDVGDTGTFEIPLARVTVPNGAASVTVTREEQYIGARVRPVRSTALPITPRRGEIVYEVDTGRWRAWTGAAWATLYEDTGELALGAGFSTWEAFSDNIGRKVNGIVSIRLSLRRTGSTFSTGDDDGSKLATVPATLRPTSRYQFATGRVTSTGGVCRVEVRPDGEVWARYPTVDVTVGRVLELTMTYPQ